MQCPAPFRRDMLNLEVRSSGWTLQQIVNTSPASFGVEPKRLESTYRYSACHQSPVPMPVRQKKQKKKQNDHDQGGKSQQKKQSPTFTLKHASRGCLPRTKCVFRSTNPPSLLHRCMLPRRRRRLYIGCPVLLHGFAQSPVCLSHSLQLHQKKRGNSDSTLHGGGRTNPPLPKFHENSPADDSKIRGSRSWTDL